MGVQYLAIFVRKHSFFVPRAIGLHHWNSRHGGPHRHGHLREELGGETKQQVMETCCTNLETKFIYVTVRAYMPQLLVFTYKNKPNNIECMYLELKWPLFWLKQALFLGIQPLTKKDKQVPGRYIVDIWYEITQMNIYIYIYTHTRGYWHLSLWINSFTKLRCPEMFAPTSMKCALVTICPRKVLFGST